MQYIRLVENKFRDISGWTFGKLIAVWPCGLTDKGTEWLCFCSCGKSKITRLDSLLNERTTSCNCVGYATSFKHGWSKTPEAMAFRNAKYRCTNPDAQAYDLYGGRGIKFLFKNFEDFIQEIGPRPSSEYLLDRIDNDGHYVSGNVKWSTRIEQAKNQRSGWTKRRANVLL